MAAQPTQLRANHLQHHADNADADPSCQCVTHQPRWFGQCTSKLCAKTTATTTPTMTQLQQCDNDNDSHNDDCEDDACNDSNGDNHGDNDSRGYDPRLRDTTMTDDNGNSSDSKGRPAL